MEQVRKTFFDPLATSKLQIRELLTKLPVGSAHPYSPEQILLCRTDNGVTEIDISSYAQDFFFNAVDLGTMGETLLRRMAGFPSHLKIFEDFQIQQAPAATFRVPIDSNQITILAVSERTPTYYDFCFADVDCNACCWLARTTFPGIEHSGDLLNGQDLLDYVKINKETLTDKEICVFISGYQYTSITRFLGTDPALLVANHVDKTLYIIPVPLDAATIGDATLCCPLVIKRDGDELICSILPTATTDRGKMCHSNKMISPCFPEAIKRADFTISAPPPTPVVRASEDDLAKNHDAFNLETLRKIMANENAIFTTDSTILPSFLNLDKTQIIKFGTGIEFELPGEGLSTSSQPSAVVLPCVFGSQLQGPILLATGTAPINVPFFDEVSLREYYQQLKSLVVIVDDRMTDNARNLATSYRINALFIVQLSPKDRPQKDDNILSLLNSANINAVTALAGPQSLVVVQIAEKYYFYRGLANRKNLNTSGLAFGADITSILQSLNLDSILDPRAERVVNLRDANAIILPTSGQLVEPQELQRLFEQVPVDQIQKLEDDISAAIPQLQVLLNQKDLSELSKSLVGALSAKVNDVTAPLRNDYIHFLTQEYEMADPESVKTKNKMLSDLRKITKKNQKALGSAITSLANMMSFQMSSKRTHDLNRLVRQAQIQGNVESVKHMTFDTLAGYLETHAGEMGVMLLNIDSTPYNQLLSNLKRGVIDASSCCDLDSRVLHLEGFDAGIIIEQSQNQHNGPLQSQSGVSQPILALPYLSQGRGSGSMLAWVCWDEFVNLRNPYTVRWIEKCNEAHIASLRIIMRATLSQATSSREYNMQPGSLETGQLMSALLMAAMTKLAAMRTTTPVVKNEAEDTVTRLMRGLFGNLLTIAGSGVRPLSMVWQLFGSNPQYDLPTTDVEWSWYETVVALYPYTGWPLKQFHENLEKLLDKAILRVVIRNESMAEIKANRASELIKFCKLRNIQLEHSRTIITIFMRMLTTTDIDIAAVSGRLLAKIPQKVDKQSQSYTKMIKYLEHLANGGQRRPMDDLVAASVYTKRSAAFSGLKFKVAEACGDNDLVAVKASCQALIDKHVETAGLWHVKPGSLKIQNMNVYRDLLNCSIDEDQDLSIRSHQLTRQVLDDAERWRVPWQVGSEGQFGKKIEPLNEAFLNEIFSIGEQTEPVASTEPSKITEVATRLPVEKKADDRFAPFKSTLKASFVTALEKNLTAEEVCDIINVPVTTMRAFVKALNPGFVWEELGGNFKEVILGLLQNRSSREESHPVKKLLDLGVESETEKLLTEE